MRLNHSGIAVTLSLSQRIRESGGSLGSRLYLREASKQLSDERFYQQIEHDATEMQHKEVITAVSRAISTFELPPKAKTLTVEHSGTLNDMTGPYAPRKCP